jgi:hypothetical protein
MVSFSFSHVRFLVALDHCSGSNSIGDWYPERSLFQILIALTSGKLGLAFTEKTTYSHSKGPRLGLVTLQYYLERSPASFLPTAVFIFGIIRTLACGGWVYITSIDDHDMHDFFMITYMVCNIPWMLGGIASTPAVYPSILRKRFFHALSL